MNLRQALNSLPYYFLEDLIQELLGKVTLNNRSAQIRVLAETMERRETVRMLWDRLEPAERAAVQLALYHDGKLDLVRYEALHGDLPAKPFSGLFGYRRKPQYLKLFFLSGWELPDEIQTVLKEWVEPPPEFQPQTLPELPPRVRVGKREVELFLVETEQAAFHDLAAALRLAGEGRLKVSESSSLPGAVALRALQKELALLDYYAVEDQRAADTIRPCGLVIALQAGGLAEAEAGVLRPSQAGETWLSKPSPEGLREAFQNWIKSTLLDELHRVNALKVSQVAAEDFTRPEQRRKSILAALGRFKPGEWIAIEEFFKTIKLSGHSFEIERGDYTAIQVAGYGLLDNASYHTYWQAAMGQYALVVLMEYLATFGAIDLACTDPALSGYSLGNLDTYVTRPFSRYDGLKFIRLTALGAYLLGQTEDYLPGIAAEVEPLLAFGENFQLALLRPQLLNPNDRLILERFSVRLGESLYRLDARRLIEAYEEGYKPEEGYRFLEQKTLKDVPEEVRGFFERLYKRSHVLARRGEALLFQVKDVLLMKELLDDPILGELCVLAEDHQLVVEAKNVDAFRRRIHELEAGVKS